jgi:hypothetical protein
MSLRSISFLACAFALSCSPSDSDAGDATKFGMIGGFGVTESSSEDSAGVFGVVANADTVVMGTRDGQIFTFDGNDAKSLKATVRESALSTVRVGDARGAGTLAISGTRAYATVASGDLHVIDVANPRAAFVIAQVPTGVPGAEQSATNDKLLAVTSGGRSALVDITQTPPRVLTPSVLFPLSHSLAMSATHLYVLLNNGLQVVVYRVDQSGATASPTPGFHVTQASGATAKATALLYHAGKLYVGGPGMLAVFDTTDPEAPKQLNANPGTFQHSFDYPYGEHAQAMAFFGDRYVAAPSVGTSILDVGESSSVGGTTVKGPWTPTPTSGAGLSLPVNVGQEVERHLYAAASRSQVWVMGRRAGLVYGAP